MKEGSIPQKHSPKRMKDAQRLLSQWGGWVWLLWPRL